MIHIFNNNNKTKKQKKNNQFHYFYLVQFHKAEKVPFQVAVQTKEHHVLDFFDCKTKIK